MVAHRWSAIRRFAEDGGGVLFSGGALAIVDHLGLEPYVRAQRHELENYRDPAALVPEVRSHPVFAGPQRTRRPDLAQQWRLSGGCGFLLGRARRRRGAGQYARRSRKTAGGISARRGTTHRLRLALARLRRSGKPAPRKPAPAHFESAELPGRCPTMASARDPLEVSAGGFRRGTGHRGTALARATSGHR